MNKQEFLNELNNSLVKQEVGDIDEIISYFDEMIEDKKEEGFKEDEIIKGLSSPDKIAQVLKEQDAKEEINYEDDNLVYKCESEGINYISIDDVGDELDVALSEDDNIYFIYPKSNKYSYKIKLKGDKLKISREDSKFFNLHFSVFKEKILVKLLLPEAYLGSLKVDTVNGSTNISSLKLKAVKIETVNGVVDIYNSEIDALKVECVNGTINLDGVSGSKFNGEIVNGNLIARDLTYDIIKGETVQGKIDLEINGQEEEYAISYDKLMTSYKLREELKNQKYLKLETVVGKIEYHFSGNLI